MKSNSKKRIIASLLVMLLILPFFTNNYVLAQEANNYNIKEVRAIIMENLKSSGLTDDEINGIIERNPITEESIKYGLLTNEQEDNPMLFDSEGDTKTTSTYITDKFIRSLGFGIVAGSNVVGWGLSKAEWVEVIVAAIGWGGFVVGGIVVGAAAACAYFYLDGVTGVKITITWKYMYGDQSMVYFWGMVGLDSTRYY